MRRTRKVVERHARRQGRKVEFAPRHSFARWMKDVRAWGKGWHWADESTAKQFEQFKKMSVLPLAAYAFNSLRVKKDEQLTIPVGVKGALIAVRGKTQIDGHIVMEANQ